MGTLLLTEFVLMLLVQVQVQSPPPPFPLRVSSEIVQSGQGAVEGRVTKLNSEEPIAEVEVTLTVVPPTSAPATVGQLRTTTDSTGHFAFRSLPPGRYLVRIQREGYFRRSLSGGSDPGQITVNAAESTSLRLWLIPGGTISGRILDPRGRPAAAVKVTAARLHYVDGRPEFNSVKETMSDDRGDYRLWGLEPGDYFVQGEKDLAGDRARSYFPGGDDGRSAMKVVVDPGAEAAKIDFALAAPRATVNISGVVTVAVAGMEGPAPAPDRETNISREDRALADVRNYQASMAQQFYLVSMEPDRIYERPVALSNAVTNSQDRAEGKFELRNVRSGAYELYAVLQDRSGPTKYYVARTAIDVGVEDLGGIALTIRPGIDFTGKVQYGPGASPPSTPLRVQLRPKVALASWPASSLSTVVSADGTFSIPNVPEAQYMISVGPLGPNSYVAELIHGRNSILDRGILIVDRRLPNTLEVAIQSRPATIQGTVSATPQQLAAGVTITLVPEDNRRENFELYRRTQATAGGSFSFSDATPGGYKLFAWENIPDGAEKSREYMESYRDRGAEIVAAAGNTSSVELRLTSK